MLNFKGIAVIIFSLFSVTAGHGSKEDADYVPAGVRSAQVVDPYMEEDNGDEQAWNIDEMSEAAKKKIEAHIYLGKGSRKHLRHFVDPRVSINILSCFFDQNGQPFKKIGRKFLKSKLEIEDEKLTGYLRRMTNFGWLKKPEKAMYCISAWGQYALTVFESIPEDLIAAQSASNKKRGREEDGQEDFDVEEDLSAGPVSFEITPVVSTRILIINPTDGLRLQLLRADRHLAVLQAFKDISELLTLQQIVDKVQTKEFKATNISTGYVSRHVELKWLELRGEHYRLRNYGLAARQLIEKALALSQTNVSQKDERRDEDPQVSDNKAKSKRAKPAVVEDDNDEENPELAPAKSPEPEGLLVASVKPSQPVYFQIQPLEAQVFFIEMLKKSILPEFVKNEEAMYKLRTSVSAMVKTQLQNKFQQWNITLGPDFDALLASQIRIYIEHKVGDAWETAGSK